MSECVFAVSLILYYIMSNKCAPRTDSAVCVIACIVCTVRVYASVHHATVLLNGCKAVDAVACPLEIDISERRD